MFSSNICEKQKFRESEVIKMFVRRIRQEERTTQKRMNMITSAMCNAKIYK